MKKYFFILSFIVVIISNITVSAQKSQNDKFPDYQFHKKGFWNVSEFTIGFRPPYYVPPFYGLSTVFGYKFSPRFTLGLGVAAVFSNNQYIIPIFVDARYYPLARRASPFIGFQLGNSTAILQNPTTATIYKIYDGLYMSPLVGIRLYIRERVALNFAISYQFHEYFSINANMICMRVGASF